MTAVTRAAPETGFESGEAAQVSLRGLGARESICACPRRFIIGQDGVELASAPRRLGAGELLAGSPAFVASGVDGS
jgi:hypothetical protein